MLADELQCAELRQLEAPDVALHDAMQMLCDGIYGDPLREQRIVVSAIGDQRQDRRVALVAGAAVRKVIQLRHAQPIRGS